MIYPITDDDLFDVMTAEAGRVPLLVVQHPDGRYLQSIKDGDPTWTTESNKALDLGPSRALSIVEHLGPMDRGRSCRIVAPKCEQIVSYYADANGEAGEEIYCTNQAITRFQNLHLCRDCGLKLAKDLE